MDLQMMFTWDMVDFYTDVFEGHIRVINNQKTWEKVCNLQIGKRKFTQFAPQFVRNYPFVPNGEGELQLVAEVIEKGQSPASCTMTLKEVIPEIKELMRVQVTHWQEDVVQPEKDEFSAEEVSLPNIPEPSLAPEVLGTRRRLINKLKGRIKKPTPTAKPTAARPSRSPRASSAAPSAHGNTPSSAALPWPVEAVESNLPEHFYGTLVFGKGEPGTAICAADNVDEIEEVIAVPQPRSLKGFRVSAWLIELRQGNRYAMATMSPAPTSNPPGTKLLLIYEGDTLRQGEVVHQVIEPYRATRHRLKLESGELINLDLNPNNHCHQWFDHADDYVQAAKEYCEAVRRRYQTLTDEITGLDIPVDAETIGFSGLKDDHTFSSPLQHPGGKPGSPKGKPSASPTSKPLVSPKGGQPASPLQDYRFGQSSPARNPHNRSGKWAVESVQEAAETLCKYCQFRKFGSPAETCQRVLIMGDMDSGRTWALHQLMYYAAGYCMRVRGSVPLLPILVTVQEFAAFLSPLHPKQANAQTLLHYVDTVLFAKHAERNKYLALLRQALQLRAVIVIFDGLDEALAVRNHLEHLIHSDLLPSGISVVCTCFPDNIGEKEKDFVILQLKPLTDEMRHSVAHKLVNSLPPKKAEFIDKLFKASEIQKANDRVWSATPIKERLAMERITGPDRFFIPESPPPDQSTLKPGPQENGTWRDMDLKIYNPEMRQHNSKGKVVSRSSSSIPQSEYLQTLDRLIRRIHQKMETTNDLGDTASVSDAATLVDASCRSLKANESEEMLKTAQAIVKRLEAKAPHISSNVSATGSTLGGSTPQTMWRDIIRRTDQLYEVAERINQIWGEILSRIVEETCWRDGNTAGYEIIVGPIKHPDRVSEKCKDIYSKRYPPGDLPEACITDLIRARVICNSGEDLLRLHATLDKGVQMRCKVPAPVLQKRSMASMYMPEEEEQDVKVECVRFRNICTPGRLNPLHYREMLYNLMLTAGVLSTIVEVEVLIQPVWKEYDISYIESVKRFFHDNLGSVYRIKLDSTLHQMFSFVKELESSNPILLMMLILMLRNQEIEEEFPNNRFNLYDKALFKSQPEATVAALQRIAVMNQVEKRTQFTLADVKKVLRHLPPSDLKPFLEPRPEIPLVKLLVLGDEPANTKFQFYHHSFQEALLARAIIRKDAKEFWKKGLEQLLQEEFYENTFRLVGPLGQLDQFPKVDIQTFVHNNQTARLAASCLPKELFLKVPFHDVAQCKATALIPFLDCLPGTELLWRNVVVGTVGAVSLSKGLRRNNSLTSIDLDNTAIGDAGAIEFARALKTNKCLKSVKIRDVQLGDEGAKKLGKALGKNSTLVYFQLRGYNVGDEGLLEIGKGLEKNLSLQWVDIVGNFMGDPGAAGLANALQVNTTLKALQLKASLMKDAGCLAVAKVMEENSTLTFLELKGEVIHDDSVKRWSEILKKNQTLKTFCLDGKMIGDPGAQAIRTALVTNTTLTCLHLSGNLISDEEKEVLKEWRKTKLITDKPKLVLPALSKAGEAVCIKLQGCSSGSEVGAVLARVLGSNPKMDSMHLQGSKVDPDDTAASSTGAIVFTPAMRYFGMDKQQERVLQGLKPVERNPSKSQKQITPANR